MAFKYFREFSFHISKAKNYPLNFIATIINELIFVIGILSMMSDNHFFSVYSIAIIFLWYIFQFTLTEMVDCIEEDIRTGGIINLMTTHAELADIYMKRACVFVMQSTIIFLFAIHLLHKPILFDIARWEKIIFAVILFVFYGISLLQIFCFTTIIWERTGTFVSLFLSIILIFGSRLPIIREIFMITKGVSFNNLIFISELVFLFLVWMLLKRKAKNKIYQNGF